ncbi:hypothetical protein ABZ896_28500 [Streptomyces sp. NPDC047072]|uniref:hypothetical protein n=1 Tax=Streptomyces sp. NPDC047072 TaxID=3154809 RepID=UPI0033C455C3
MPLFRRAEVPRDHRDEVVAGALVAAVVIVLGYASGIGAPAGTAEAATPPAATPATTTPPAATPGTATGQVPSGSGELPSYGGVGADAGYGTGGYATGGYSTGGYGTGSQGAVTGGTGTLPTTPGDGGHSGHTTSPAPPAGTPTPTPSPTDACATGEVSLVQPLLSAVTDPVFGLLNGSTASPSPEPSPCVGLAPASSLLGGLLAPSPQPEATP